MANSKTLSRKRIHMRVRKKIKGTPARPRLSVFRSNKGIYCQLIDDVNGVTLASASTSDLAKAKGSKVEQAKQVGQIIAEKAAQHQVQQVVFDRGGYLYHGRVKALAEGAREKGLKF
ncbi:MAG: 50S ribosomal protein L18 [Saprospiraceae bacterium]|nr:50S ribosomal protein L18 [Saprospiraceae bacterium]